MAEKAFVPKPNYAENSVVGTTIPYLLLVPECELNFAAPTNKSDSIFSDGLVINVQKITR